MYTIRVIASFMQKDSLHFPKQQHIAEQRATYLHLTVKVLHGLAQGHLLHRTGTGLFTPRNVGEDVDGCLGLDDFALELLGPLGNGLEVLLLAAANLACRGELVLTRDDPVGGGSCNTQQQPSDRQSNLPTPSEAHERSRSLIAG